MPRPLSYGAKLALAIALDRIPVEAGRCIRISQPVPVREIMAECDAPTALYLFLKNLFDRSLFSLSCQEWDLSGDEEFGLHLQDLEIVRSRSMLVGQTSCSRTL